MFVIRDRFVLFFNLYKNKTKNEVLKSLLCNWYHHHHHHLSVSHCLCLSVCLSLSLSVLGCFGLYTCPPSHAVARVSVGVSLPEHQSPAWCVGGWGRSCCQCVCQCVPTWTPEPSMMCWGMRKILLSILTSWPRRVTRSTRKLVPPKSSARNSPVSVSTPQGHSEFTLKYSPTDSIPSNTGGTRHSITNNTGGTRHSLTNNTGGTSQSY